MSQETHFTKGEADAWFERNMSAMQKRTDVEKDPVLRVMNQYQLRPVRALEIGASNGYRMHVMREAFGTEAHAIEPSAKAVADGKQKYPEVHFETGVASPLPYATGEFDCVVVCGVFCWIDRSQLLQAVSEADRVLKNGGHLLIGDFMPPRPERVRYHHREDAEIYTYKQDYSAMFRAAGIYELLASEVFDHAGFVPKPEIAQHDRFAVTLLRKDWTEGYLTKSRPDSV